MLDQYLRHLQAHPLHLSVGRLATQYPEVRASAGKAIGDRGFDVCAATVRMAIFVPRSQ